MFLFEWKKFSFRIFFESFWGHWKECGFSIHICIVWIQFFFKMIQWLHGQSSLKLYEVTTPLKISIGNQDKRIRLVSIHFSFFQEFSLLPGAFRRLKPRLNKVFNKAWIRGVSGLFLAFRKIWIFTNPGGFSNPG